MHRQGIVMKHAISIARLMAFGLSALSVSANAQDPAPLPPTSFPVPRTETQEHWYTAGAEAVQKRIAVQPNTKTAKNIILFVGDGMGISSLTAGRIFEGQLRGESGEENFLSFEQFPYSALVKTYNTDAQVADSAGTASALNTGVKTYIGAINTAPYVRRGACPTRANGALIPFAELAEKSGRATGIVSTARLTHATPAAVYATASVRDMEADTDLSAEMKQQGCRDIAQQITDRLGGDGLEVALGGGRKNFLPVTGSPHGTGIREDGRDIVQEWLNRSDGAQYANTWQDLLQKKQSPGPLLGLFSESHMSYALDQQNGGPSLAEMTRVAIEHLSAEGSGFYLMVEGGRIDHAHHAGNAKRALAEVVELSDAVKTATEMLDMNETLILVTADHSHVFTLAGYPPRGNPILGPARQAGSFSSVPRLAADGKPYTTLGYQNGPGAVIGVRANPAETNTEALDYKQQALVPLSSETHGGEDVALFGIGPWAHLVRGTMEQNVVFHIMTHAAALADRNP